MKKVILLLIPFFILSCSSENDNVAFFKATTWNAYCFFDSRDDGSEYQGFTLSKGYNIALYEKRIKNTASFMSKYFADSDVIILEEIESEQVLSDLLENGLGRRGFIYYGVAQKDVGYLSVGFISKIRPSYVKTHSVASSRLILDLGFRLEDEMIHIIGLHASSRLDDENENKRYEEFSLLRSIFDQYREEITIALGDYNTDPRRPEKGLSCDENYPAPIMLTYDRGNLSDGFLYTPAADMYTQYGRGTYYYQGEWMHYDNAVFNCKAFDSEGWEYDQVRIIEAPEALDTLMRPRAFDVSKGEGFSDHLPVTITLNYK